MIKLLGKCQKSNNSFVTSNLSKRRLLVRITLLTFSNYVPNQIAMKTAYEIVSVLNNLIETHLERIKGYETAAAHAEDAETKELCLSFSGQSKAFKTQLEQLVREYNGKPIENGSAKGAAYRTTEVDYSILDS